MLKRIIVFFVVFLSFVDARAPLESYKHYLLVLVHGVGANTQLPNDYELSFGPEYEKGAPRKSSIFDKSADDDRGITVPAADSNWQGDIGGSLQKRGFLGHTMWYDFYEPWRTPIYDAQDSNKQISLSRYLGDRDMNNNPMGEYRPNYRYFIGDVEFKNAVEAVKACNENMDALFRCVENTTISGFTGGDVGALVGGTFSCNNVTNGKKIIFTNPIDCIKNIVVDSSSRGYFGQTANSRWLHRFFPDDLSASEKVEYKGHTGSFLNLAQEDWKLWHKLRYGKDADEGEIPKKYILIAHSMGGLTTRDYLTSSFYKGDVDKLITLDSPHEGSEIANYVQNWHYSAIDNNGWVRFTSKAFDMALTIPLTLLEIADACELSVVKDPFTLSKKWVTVLNVLSVLYKPEFLQEFSNSIANGFSGYHENAMVFGNKVVEQGIDVMTLSNVQNQRPDDFLENFNARGKLQDVNNNGYCLPFFDIVSTSGVPTPGSPNLYPSLHKDITTSFFNIPAILNGILDAGVTSLDDFSNDGLMLNLLHRMLAPIALQSIWNDDGSGFVPSWSSEGNRVSLFSQKNSDVSRYKISFDYEDVDKIEGVSHTIGAVVAVVGTFLVLKQLEVLDLSIPDGVKCAGNILSAMGLSAMIANMFDVNDLPIASLKEELYRYAGFHGYMVKKVDSQKASDAGNTEKKMLDQLLWESPSVSFVYNPVNPWDDSQGGYIGMATTAEKVSVSAVNAGEIVPVKWNDEVDNHEFVVNLTEVTNDSENTEEVSRKKTIYIAGKNAGTHLKAVKYSYNQLNQDGVAEDINHTISVDKCKIIGGLFENNVWTVQKDNEGFVSCEMELPGEGVYNVKLELDAYEENGKGALLVDVGREPGKVFVAGGNGLIKAENTDWDRYITFKNRRYQKKNNVENPKEEDLDKTVAQMVDYRRTPLLVVNKLPRVFDLEVDDLQPDRMNKIEILFNFGSSKIIYEAQRDPNSFDESPKGFKNHPEGFVDPALEKYSVSINIGEESVTEEIDNPIDAWGKLHIDMDALESILGKDKGWLQPFLEGRNHLRIHSVNRWGMSRVQDMNLFIPGPPPTVQMIKPMADDAFCGKSKLIFRTNLIYNQSSDLEESDIDVYYMDALGNVNKINGFEIAKLKKYGNTLYEVSSKEEINWPNGTTAVNVKVTPRVNGVATSPVNYMFTMTQDCELPVIAFSNKQSLFNPSRAMFSVSDKIQTDGDDGVVEDVLIELNEIGSTDVKLLDAIQFASSGAKVREIDLNKKEDGKYVYPDGSYVLSVRAHDNTIEDNEADVERKKFWATYGESLPNTKLPFAKYCSSGTDEKCMTQWAIDFKKIIIDHTPPEISQVSFKPEQRNGNLIVTDRDKEFFIEIVATEKMRDELNEVSADVIMTACDRNGKEMSSFTVSGRGMKEEGENEKYKIKVSVFDESNENAEMLLQKKSNLISDGIYGLKIVVKDGAGNQSGYKTMSVHLDRTAPRIINAVVPYSPSSGSEHRISFAVDEMDDVDALKNSDGIAINVFARCGDEYIEYIHDDSELSSSELTYKATIPSNVRGECLSVISAIDAAGNERKSENKFVVDLLPPEIVSPVADGAQVSGRFGIYGNADAPTLNTNSGFAWYELSYVKLNEDGSEIGSYVDAGISVPEDKRCGSRTNRSCEPVRRDDASNILGYWNTDVLKDAEEGDLYRIRLVTSDNDNNKQYAYRIVSIGKKKSESPSIVLKVDDTHVDFGSGKKMNICWNVNSTGPGLVRLNISRNDSLEDYSYLTKSFEESVPTRYLGEPSQTTEKGVYLWINDEEGGDEYSNYHLRLVPGNQKTVYHLSFYSLDESVQLLKNEVEVQNFSNTLMGLPDEYFRISAEFERSVDAGDYEDLVLRTKSRKGLYWSVAASYMKEGFNDPIKLIASPNQDKYIYFGRGRSPLVELFNSAEINIPSVIGGRCFAWNGKIEQKNVNVPSGKYKITATLEDQDDKRTAVDCAYVDVVAAPLNITEMQVTPKVVPFSPVINSNVTLSFKIDQDSKVSVFARKKKCSLKDETDVEEYMNLTLNGTEVPLNKQSLAGRDVPYVVNWNGWYNKTKSVKPYACGYEFVVQAYDLDGQEKLKEETVDFMVEAKDMYEDQSDDVLLYVDGDSTNTIEKNNVKYLVAQGMNDAVLEFSPRGKRMLNDDVEIDLKYKGRQLVETIPFERYSIGVQIHKTQIDYWVVLGAHYTRLREKKFTCNEETKQATHVSIQDIRFDESDPFAAKEIAANFSDSRSSDLNGRMSYAYVSALLIPKSNASRKQIIDLAKIVDSEVDVVSNIDDDVDGDAQEDAEEGDYTITDVVEPCENCYSQQTAWNALKKLSTINFDWQTEELFGGNLSSVYYYGVKSSGRESESDYKSKFGTTYSGFDSAYGMPAVVNSTNLWWHSGCDLGQKVPAGTNCLSEGSDLSDFCKNTGDVTCGNGVYDKGEPTLAVDYDEGKHKPEMQAYAYAWKNTDGENKVYDPSGCLGCSSCRHNLKVNLTFIPTERFWAGAVADYGWQNDVNRYLSLDPLNKNFLFGVGAPFEDVHPRFIRKNGKPVEFNLKNTSKEKDVLAQQSLMTLLYNRTFQKFYVDENGVNVYTGELDDNVQMILHYFKIEPNSRKYYPMIFDIGVKMDGVTQNFEMPSGNKTTAIPIGGYKSGKDLIISISMNPKNIINENYPDYTTSKWFDWPLTSAMPEGDCDAYCGDEESDVLYAFAETHVEESSEGSFVSEDGYMHFVRKVNLMALPDGVNGYDVSSYLMMGDVKLDPNGKPEATYLSNQGPNSELLLTNSSVVTIYDAIPDLTSAYQNDYEIRNNIVFKKGAYNGVDYVVEKDPLMLKIDDDGDGLIAEDDYDSENLDDDGDLAIDEDPSDAIRVHVNVQFPFVGGGSGSPERKFNIADLIRAKTEEHNKNNPQKKVVPGASDEFGWSIFKPDWTDAENLLTQWEESNDVSKLKRTGIYYKDGKKNTDIVISEVGALDDYDATNGYLVLKADKFDGRDRRIIEVRGKMPFNAKTDKYEIYASSETGWINLTPENPRTTTEHTLSGTLAYWDVTTSGFHQLLLIRHVNGDKFYKIFDVAVGNKNTKVAGDALGRTQISTSYEMEFVDVVPLGADEVPQTIPGGGKMGPVVQIYPAVSLYKDALTVRLRYTYDEVKEQGWTDEASIYVIGPNESPTRLQAVTWTYYDAQSKSVSRDDVWAYAVIAGVLPGVSSENNSMHSLNMGKITKLTSSNDSCFVTVEKQDNNAFVVTVDGK